MRIIYTFSGDEIMVDDALFEILSTKRWYSLKSPYGNTYARAYHKGEHLYMHRLVMEEPEGMVIDHLDCNGLNNQRYNLEVVTLAENSRRVSMRAKAKIDYDAWKKRDSDKSLPNGVNHSFAQILGFM